jgi:hypothetical protein
MERPPRPLGIRHLPGQPRWNGHHDHWEFAIYLASRDGYEPNILPSGWPTGTPEEAIDCAGLLYLNDWTQRPKD